MSKVGVMDMPINQAVEKLAASFLLRKPRRTGSFIITLFGDIVTARGEGMWLGNISNILDLFGMNAGLIRTTLTRLVADNWLKREHKGRYSFYSFSDYGAEQAANAAAKIYSISDAKWAGQWQQIILISNIGHNAKSRQNAKKQLEALGFGRVNAHIFVKPEYFNFISEEMINGACQGEPLLFANGVNYIRNGGAVMEATKYWDLKSLNQDYRGFYELYKPILQKLLNGSKINSKNALILRLLLIHDYRKILLKDPYLPLELHDINWFGFKVQNLVADIYNLIKLQADAQLEIFNDKSQLPDLSPVNQKTEKRF